ncbi:hypothetical protein ECZU51_58900 [Escherichia coli]|nr:hypothetical protein ECZU51_58900 [Escherichia coli]
MQGVVRLNGTLYPALATPTADSRQLVINAMTDRAFSLPVTVRPSTGMRTALSVLPHS